MAENACFECAGKESRKLVVVDREDDRRGAARGGVESAKKERIHICRLYCAERNSR